MGFPEGEISLLVGAPISPLITGGFWALLAGFSWRLGCYHHPDGTGGSYYEY